jgi:hypothetical protein
MSPPERNAFYKENATYIIADIREIGRAETRQKWGLTKDGLSRQERIWVKQGLITKKDRGKWTKASLILRTTGGPKLDKKKNIPSLSSSDRGRKITETEKLYRDDEVKIALGDISMGDMKMEMTLKMGKKTLVKIIRAALDE